MITTKSDGHQLEILLYQDFNINAVEQIREAMGNHKKLIIDLKHAKFVDSEAIVFLHRLLDDGYDIKMRSIPDILHECLHILNLDSEWNLKAMRADP